MLWAGAGVLFFVKHLTRYANAVSRAVRQHEGVVNATESKSLSGAGAAGGRRRGLHAVAGLEVGAGGKLIHDAHECFVTQHASDELRHGGNNFAQPSVRQFGKKGGGNLAADVGSPAAWPSEERGFASPSRPNNLST
jgi:hypothetical protein